MNVSVVIPTYNRGYCILRAVESVIKQSVNCLEILVVDDGSTDDTADVLENYIRRYKLQNKINFIRTKNSGVSAARNLGVSESSGDWLAFLDSDDEWLSDKILKQTDYLKKNPTVPLVHGEEIWIRNGVRVNQKKIHKKYGGKIFARCLPLCLISPSATVIRKDIFEDVGCFDESFPVCEDYDLWLKITSLYEVGFISEPVIVKFGGHADQLSRKYKAMDYWRIKSMSRILETVNLSENDRNLTIDEIKKKGKVLLNGYIKHNNMEKFDEIRKFYSMEMEF